MPSPRASILLLLLWLAIPPSPAVETGFQAIDADHIAGASWSLRQRANLPGPPIEEVQWRESVKRAHLDQPFLYLPASFPKAMISALIADRYAVSVATGNRGGLKGYVAAHVAELSDAELAYAYNLFVQGDPVISAPMKVVEVSLPEDGN